VRGEREVIVGEPGGVLEMRGAVLVGLGDEHGGSSEGKMVRVAPNRARRRGTGGWGSVILSPLRFGHSVFTDAKSREIHWGDWGRQELRKEEGERKTAFNYDRGAGEDSRDQRHN